VECALRREGGREGGREGDGNPYLVEQSTQAGPIPGHTIHLHPLPHRVSFGQTSQKPLDVSFGQNSGGFGERGGGAGARERVVVVAGGREGRRGGRGGGTAVDGWRRRREGGREGSGRVQQMKVYVGVHVCPPSLPPSLPPSFLPFLTQQLELCLFFLRVQATSSPSSSSLAILFRSLLPCTASSWLAGPSRERGREGGVW